MLDVPFTGRPRGAGRAWDGVPQFVTLIRRINAFGVQLESESDRAGFRGRGSRLGPELGARDIGATVYEIEPGQSTWPYHFHYGNEEWILALSGHPSVRHPDGEDVLDPGDLVAFTDDLAGAHQVINRTNERARVIMFSTQRSPQLTVYPDSRKIGVKPPGSTSVRTTRSTTGKARRAPPSGRMILDRAARRGS